MICDVCGKERAVNYGGAERTICKRCAEKKGRSYEEADPTSIGSAPVAAQREHKFCSECGEKISPRAAVCPSCGVETGFTLYPQKAKESVSDSVVGAGYGLAILLPIVGVILGIYILNKNVVGHGIAIIVISIICWVFWAAVLFRPAVY